MPRSVWNWVILHPFRAIVLILLGVLFLLAGSTGELEEGATRTSLFVGLGIIWLIVALPLILIKRKRPDSAKVVTEKQRPSEAVAINGTAVPRAPQTSSPSVSQEPPSPVGESAFYETSHQSIPIRPSDRPAGSLLTLKDMLNLDPTQFEEFCVKALQALGYVNVQRQGGAGDLTADITAKDPQGRSVIVQCKRYKLGSKIGSPVIQTFIGMKSVHHQADRGIFMTTADYSAPAISLARKHDIVMIDGDDLVKIAGLVMAPEAPAVLQGPIRFCGQCGQEFKEHARFCTGCGASRSLE